jgi:hypothetical protein
MRGIELTRPTDDLAYIFFKIRESRWQNVRRSWQRRARLALAKRTDLTPAERHEVCAVWSKSDCSRIDSPALSKFLGRTHIKFEGSRPASSVVRRRFDVDGQPVDRAVIGRCSVSRIDHVSDSDLHRQVLNTWLYVAWLCAKFRSQGYKAPHLHRDSAAQMPVSDSPLSPSRRRGRMPEKCKLQPKKRKLLKFLSSQNKPLKV